MLHKAVLRSTFLIILTCFVLYGCSTGQSRVWVNEKASFENYTVFEVRPFFNATGGDLKGEILTALTALLREELEGRDFRVAKPSQANTGVLLVNSSVLTYQGCRLIKGTASTGLATPGAANTSTTTGQSMCTVQTQLIDKATGQIVAKIFTTKVVGACFTDNFKDQWLLRELSVDIAKKVAKIMKA